MSYGLLATVVKRMGARGAAIVTTVLVLLVVGLLPLLTVPLTSDAQPTGKTYRIGFLGNTPLAPPPQPRVRNRLPLISGERWTAEAGALMTFGTPPGDGFRRVIPYVDKILKGARPADLPVEQPTKFEFVVNLKTAKAIGVAIPGAILAQADHVIE